MSFIHIMEKRPHAVCIPYPAQGHINPMMKLAKLLHYKGFHITFVNTEYNQKRLLASRGIDSYTGISSFRFETIPDGLPSSDGHGDITQDIPSLCESTTKTCLGPFRELLTKLNNSTGDQLHEGPPVSCIVSDGCMSFTLEAAEELGIPEVLFWTVSACGFLSYVHYADLIRKGFSPLKDESCLTNGYLDTTLDIPGMEGIRLRDMPSFIRTTNPEDIMLNFIVQETERSKKASAILLNTFEELEHDAIQYLSSNLPPIYPIGPLHSLERLIDHDERLKLLGANLWKEESECLEWLDSKESKSVVYVNFGSITVMTSNQLFEFAWGLANSNQTFLWIIRPDLVSGDLAVLPYEFTEVTKERGMLAKWCPQEKVLSHPAIGGFLTHNGWNSTLESISNGVPMICWPFFAEQQTNCWYCCSKLGIGMEINSDVKRHEVEILVIELMVGEKGKEMKNKAMDWKRRSKEAVDILTGSSFMNLDKLINQVLLTLR